MSEEQRIKDMKGSKERLWNKSGLETCMVVYAQMREQILEFNRISGPISNTPSEKVIECGNRALRYIARFMSDVNEDVRRNLARDEVNYGKDGAAYAYIDLEKERKNIARYLKQLDIKVERI